MSDDSNSQQAGEGKLSPQKTLVDTPSASAPTSVPTRLPMEVLLRVVENACATDEWASQYGLDPDAEDLARVRHLKRRYRNIKNYMLVCRQFFAAALPLLFQHAYFLRHTGLQTFETILDSRSTIQPSPTHTRWHRNGCYVRTLDLSYLDEVKFRSHVSDDEDSEEDGDSDSDSSEDVRPRRRDSVGSSGRGRKHVPTKQHAGVDLVGIIESCPLLECIILGGGTYRISLKTWNDLYASLQHPNLVALRGVCLPHSRPETAALLDLLNDMPGLAEFSATSLALQADLALSLIEIFRMNEKLASHKTGLRVGGLRSLSFGGDCELPIAFLTAIPRACPNLRAFHLFAGASILQGNGLLDLDTFVASFPALEAFTFLGDPSLNTNSSFDRVLESQPSLLYLHLRADFISLDFFLRTSPTPALLQSLSVDITSLARGEGLNGTNTLPWHLSLAFDSARTIQASALVAREFRRQGLGWTMTTGAGVRTQLLRRLFWASERGVAGEEGEEQGEGVGDEVGCACSSEEEESTEESASAENGGNG